MKFLNKIMRPVKWKNLRATQPISSVFGLDRGMPVDRYYIEKFLSANGHLITGRILEIGDNTYTKKFGRKVVLSEVLSYEASKRTAVIHGDLTKFETLPSNAVDCLICTQTLNFIYDFKSAIAGIRFLLKDNGTALVTLAGLCQISQYDMERWGDFWRFTSRSALESFAEVFGKENVSVGHYGNVLAGVSLLHGISAEELTKEELDVKDPNYQIVITVIAKKC